MPSPDPITFATAARNELGAFLMNNVRDSALREWSNILASSASAPKGEAARQVFLSLDASSQAAILELVARVATSTLHHFLWALEQNDHIMLAFDKDGRIVDLKGVSDGLPGELYGTRGWIARFAKEGRFIE